METTAVEDQMEKGIVNDLETRVDYEVQPLLTDHKTNPDAEGHCGSCWAFATTGRASDFASGKRLLGGLKIIPLESLKETPKISS